MTEKCIVRFRTLPFCNRALTLLFRNDPPTATGSLATVKRWGRRRRRLSIAEAPNPLLTTEVSVVLNHHAGGDSTVEYDVTKYGNSL